MRYGDEDRESSNVEDRRSERGPMFRFPGGMGGGRTVQIPLGSGGVSLGSLLIIGVLLLLFGVNPLDLLSEANYPQVPQMPHTEPAALAQHGRIAARRSRSRVFPADAPCAPRTT